MGIKLGEIDSGQILDNEFRINVLEIVLDKILQKNPNIIGLTQNELEDIRVSVANNLKRKYPKAGIEYKRVV